MKPIQVFEHDILRTDRGEERISIEQLKALQAFYGDAGVPYYTLINNGVKFCEYVGVIQVGSTTIEVLPKAGKLDNKKEWQEILIDMLKSVGVFDVHVPSTSTLQLKPNSILELYFSLFIAEVEGLLHAGLVKKYRTTEGNSTSLKGSLQFAKQIRINATHRERFYVRHTIYDRDHLLHHILFKTIHLINRISNQVALKNRIGTLLLHFPEMQDVRVSEETFSRLRFNRKTESYRKAIGISRLLLLNYHPDVKKGRNDVLALMFDMNALWEKFVYVSLRDGLRKNRRGGKLRSQVSRYFWRPRNGNRSTTIPDLVYAQEKKSAVVLDTKWKNPGPHPTPDDLRQMYVYLHYHNAGKAALVYPGNSPEKQGDFLDRDTQRPTAGECGMIFIPVEKNIDKWKEGIYKIFETWLDRPLHSDHSVTNP